MRPVIRDGECSLKSPGHCAWCQDAAHEAFREQIGATMPCSAGGPFVETGGTFRVIVRRKGCAGCLPLRFG